MTTYVDASALLKRYVAERDSDRADEILASDDRLVTGRHTVVEVRRNLVRLLDGSALHDAQEAFAADLQAIALVELDESTCELAAAVAEQTGVRTLDALHLGAARRVGLGLTFATFDVRQAQAARAVGFVVAGA
jgi:predicted nucleic acid-binding protein